MIFLLNLSPPDNDSSVLMAVGLSVCWPVCLSACVAICPSACQMSLCQTSLCQTSLCQTSLCQTSLCQTSLCQTSLCLSIHRSSLSACLFHVVLPGISDMPGVCRPTERAAQRYMRSRTPTASTTWQRLLLP